MADRGYIASTDPSGHTLVVVFLRGGADGLNMVVPVEDDSYYNARTLIGIPKKDTTPLDGMFGLHPLLAPLQRPFRDGKLLIVHGAGSEDETRSHFEAQDYMEHGGIVAGGWLGRWLRASRDSGNSPLTAVALGRTQPEVLRGAPASVVMESFEEFGFEGVPPAFFEQLRALYALEKDALGQAGHDVLNALGRIEELRQQDYKPAQGAMYPANAFGDKLRQSAQLIRANVGVKAITLDLDGWDSHFATATLMNPLLESLALGLEAFYTDLGADLARVSMVVMTEFGRRVRENASFGTDHGCGGVMWAMGGGVAGGRVLHDWKGLNDDLLEGPGDVPLSFNYRDVLAGVLGRHGGISSFEGVFPAYDTAPVALYG